MSSNEKPAEKRRLPVIQSKEGAPGEPAEERPPARWIPYGAVGTLLVWLPLSMLAETAAPRNLVAHTLAFFAGAVAGGLLVVRLGQRAGPREGALGGAAAGVLAWLVAMTQGTAGGALTWGLLVAVIALIGAAGGALGGLAGARMRRGER